MKLKSLAFISVFIFTLTGFAADKAGTAVPIDSYSMPAIEVGFKWNTAQITGSTSDKQEAGLQLGASAVFNFTEKFGVKSGLFYSERPFRSEFSATSSGKGKISYFEVPAFLMLKMEDYAGVYLGPSVAIKLGDEFTPGSMTEIKTMVVPVTFGAQFKFAPNMGVNLFFEAISGDLATGVSNSRAVGANLLFTID